MARSIAEYTAEISKSYDNSRNALQNQINAIEGDLAKTQSQINQNYDLQQTNIDNQKNWASSAASMAASKNGGSFGGATEVANKKYYEQTFVPAQTQLNTNRSQALENAQSQANSNRLTLEQQLAAMNDEIARLGVQRYYDVLEQEREDAYRKQQLALQRQQIASQNAAAQYLAQAQARSQQPTYKNWDFGNGYSIQESPTGEAIYLRNGNRINAGNFLEGTGANGVRWDLWNDVWNNGISTSGVGGDTVSAFNRQSPTSSNYNYLFGR